MRVVDMFLTKNQYSRPGTPLKGVKGIVIHWVANAGSTAVANLNYFENLRLQVPPKNTRYASAHYIIGMKGDVFRCVPDNEVCYHVGAETYTPDALKRLSAYPNNCTIGIELCHPGWDGKFTEETLESCRELVRSLLDSYGLTREDIWRHYDITSKVCPKYFVEHEDAWDAFRESV